MSKKVSTKAKDFKVEDVLSAIDGSYGIMSTIAEVLNCSWITAKKYVEMYDEAKAAMLDEEQKALDMAENTVLRSIQMDNTQDAKWYLSKKGKARGYGDELAITGKDGSSLFPPATSIKVTLIGMGEHDNDADDMGA
jgi:hypothetical protein